MAKASAVCTCKTCGETFTVSTFKTNRREADSWEKWAADHYDECDACRTKRIEAERAAESAKAAAEAKDLGLPELNGTPKQVAWAERIRADFLREWGEWEVEAMERFKAGRKAGRNITRDAFFETKDYILGKTGASWWIDHKDDLLDPIGYVRGKKAYEAFYKKAHEESLEKEVKAEAPAPEIIEPESKTHNIVCAITADSEVITVESDYDRDMPPIVKSLGYRWDSSRRVWKKAVSYRIPSTVDAMAEVANKLLTAGFIVTVPSEVKDKAINGTYEPEHQRWIFWWENDKMFGFSGDVQPKGIPRYGHGQAPIESYAEVEEFAKINDFRFSPGAREAIDAYKARITKVAVTEGKGPEYQDKTGEIKAILNSSKDILEDLVDED